jgi:hypothetical protein
LLFTHTLLPDPALRVDVDAEPAQERAGRLLDATAVDDSSGNQRLAAEEDIVGGGQFGDETEFLVNDRDARAFVVLNASEPDRSARQSNFAVIFYMHTGEDFHQRAFAGAILPDQRMHFAAL